MVVKKKRTSGEVRPLEMNPPKAIIHPSSTKFQKLKNRFLDGWMVWDPSPHNPRVDAVSSTAQILPAPAHNTTAKPTFFDNPKSIINQHTHGKLTSKQSSTQSLLIPHNFLASFHQIHHQFFTTDPKKKKKMKLLNITRRKKERGRIYKPLQNKKASSVHHYSKFPNPSLKKTKDKKLISSS